ncbi:MAG: cysteine peptidase family C39 domain-containing protein [Planctomycetota bacterium]|nr:cysteine peptidase family C39 domain-containing protein [Planctomycetota bacterium]
MWRLSRAIPARQALNASAAVFSRDENAPCGAVSIVLASRLLDRPLALSQVCDSLVADPMGRSTMREMIQTLDELGFAAAPIILSTRDFNNVDELPLIVHLDSDHWAVVFHNEQGCAVLLNPPSEPRFVTRKSLEANWNGTSIVVSRSSQALTTFLASVGVRSQNAK